MGRESQHVNRNVIYAAAESLVMLSTDAAHSQADKGNETCASLRGDSHILKNLQRISHSAAGVVVTLGQRHERNQFCLSRWFCDLHSHQRLILSGKLKPNVELRRIVAPRGSKNATASTCWPAILISTSNRPKQQQQKTLAFIQSGVTTQVQ